MKNEDEEEEEAYFIMNFLNGEAEVVPCPSQRFPKPCNTTMTHLNHSEIQSRQKCLRAADF
eukprot:1338017-Amphidinium_carterae.1